MPTNSGPNVPGVPLDGDSEMCDRVLGYLVPELAPDDDPKARVCESWRIARETGQLLEERSSVTFPIVGAQRDDLVASIVPNRFDGKPWFLLYAGPDKKNALDLIRQKSLVPQSLYDLAYIDWAKVFEVTEEALPEAEGWGPANNPMAVFKSYLSNTYERLVLEGKVRVSRRFGLVAFNSGLVTPSYDELILCFTADTRSESGWSYAGFCVSGQGFLGKRLLDAFPKAPERAQYVSDPVDLVFDPSREIAPDYHHIIADNLARLPEGYLKERLRARPDIAQALEDARLVQGTQQRKEALRCVGAMAWDDVDLRNVIHSDIQVAVERGRRRAAWNLRTTVPAYYPRRKSMSLLLPLCLERWDVTDLALVLSLGLAGSYKGETILDMSQAYNDARLVSRPESEWLRM